MLNVFPSLLIPFLAPTVLRVLVALVLFYIAYQQYKRSDEIGRLPMFVSGPVFVWPAILFHTLVGLMLLFGYYTQVAALLAVAAFLKGWWLNSRYPSVTILPTPAVVILIVVSLSLVLSGAGAFAQDLPL